jgi:hypothetical protein
LLVSRSIGAPVQESSLARLVSRLDEILRVTSYDEMAFEAQAVRMELASELRRGDPTETGLQGQLPEWAARVARVESLGPRNRYPMIRRLYREIAPKMEAHVREVRTMRRRAWQGLQLPEVRSDAPMAEVVRRGLRELVRHADAALRVAARLQGRYRFFERLNPDGGAAFWIPGEIWRFRRWNAEENVLTGLLGAREVLKQSRVTALNESLEVLEDTIPGLSQQPVEQIGSRLQSWRRIRQAITHEMLLQPTWQLGRDLARVRSAQGRLKRVLAAFLIRVGDSAGSPEEGAARQELLELQEQFQALEKSWDPVAVAVRIAAVRAKLREVPDPDAFTPLKQIRKGLLSHFQVLQTSLLFPAERQTRGQIQEVEGELSGIWSRLGGVRIRLASHRLLRLLADFGRDSDEIRTQS